jgi:hypothetical protein
MSFFDPVAYWTVLASVIAAFWAVISLYRARMANAYQYNSNIVERLLDCERIIIDQPEIQQYLSRSAIQPPSYFRQPERLEEKEFYQAKAHAYAILNLFDEICTSSVEPKKHRTRFRKFLRLLHPHPILEINDWKNYMIEKSLHPLFQSILKEEAHIFGERICEVLNIKRRDDPPEDRPADPFVW